MREGNQRSLSPFTMVVLLKLNLEIILCLRRVLGLEQIDRSHILFSKSSLILTLNITLAYLLKLRNDGKPCC